MNTFGSTLWSADEVRALRDLYATHTAQQIGMLLGRSKSSVEHKIQALNLSPKGAHKGAHAEAPSATLREENAAARAEWATAPLYRPGSRDD